MTGPKSMLRFVCLLAGALSAALPIRQAAAAEPRELLKNIPADAWAYVIVKSVDNLDAKVGMIGQRMALPVMPLKPMMISMLNLGDTLDATSALAVVSLNYQEYADKGVAFLVPTKDPEALLEKLGAGEDKKDGVIPCKVMEEPMFAAIKGKLVIIGPNEDVVGKVSKAKETADTGLAEARASLLNSSDLFVSVAPHLIMTAYKDMIMTYVGMMGAAMGGSSTGVEPIISMLNQMKSFDIGLNISEKGIGASFVMSGKDGSDLEKLFGDIKNSSEPLLGWLPKEKYLFAIGAQTNQSEHAAKFGGDAADLLKGMGPGMAPGLDRKALTSLVKEWSELAKGIERYAMSFSALPEGPDGMLGFTCVAQVKDANTFLDGVRKLYDKVWTLSDEEDMQSMKDVVVHKADAETAGDKKVDTVIVDLSKLDPDRAEGDAAEIEKVHKVLGKDLVIRFGAVDGTHFAVTFGGGTSRYQTVASAIKSPGSSLSSDAAITAASSNLPSPRASEAFLALDTILKTIKSINVAVGEADKIPIDVPEVNAPLSFGATRQGKVCRGDMFIPMKLLDGAKEIYQKQMMKGMNDFDEDDQGDSDAKDADEDDSGDHSQPDNHKEPGGE